MPSLDSLFTDWEHDQQVSEENRKRLQREDPRMPEKPAWKLRKLRAIKAQERVELAKLAPERGRPTMICDKCNHVRDAQYVQVIESWPRTEYVCIVCKSEQHEAYIQRKAK